MNPPHYDFVYATSNGVFSQDKARVPLVPYLEVAATLLLLRLVELGRLVLDLLLIGQGCPELGHLGRRHRVLRRREVALEIRERVLELGHSILSVVCVYSSPLQELAEPPWAHYAYNSNMRHAYLLLF